MGQCFPERQREQLSLDGCSTVFRRRPYLRRGIGKTWRLGQQRYGWFQPFLNQGMSFTERGTLMLEPLRLGALLVLNVPADSVASTTLSATALPFATALAAAPFPALAALVLEDLAADAAFLVVDLAFEATP